jgi:hypothetical protein
MAVKTVYDTPEDVPEALRNEYKEVKDTKTGKVQFVLDVEGPIEVLPAVRTIKDEAARRRIEATDLSKKLDKYKVLGDMDPSEILTKLDKFPELEAALAGKTDDEKINAIVETRVKGRIGAVERDRDTWKTKAGELEKINEGYTTAERNRMIKGAAGSAARSARMLNEAIEDLELLAERVLEIDAAGDVVTKEGVGVTPGLTPEQWVAELQTKRPHWWGTTGGGGAGGGRNAAGGLNPFTHDNWNITEQSKLYKADPKRADAQARAAGTTVGGRRPPAKK